MTPEAQIDALLAKWEDDPSLTAETLCRDCPELVETVRRKIVAYGRAQALIDTVDGDADKALLETASFVGKSTGSGEAVDVCERIGKYRFVRKLGGGGQGAAYLAFDPDLQREVVLKIYHLHDPQAQEEAVLKEGQALAKIRSPYVAQCHAVEREGDKVYLVIEYISGRPLHKAGLSLPRDRVKIIRVLEQVAEGLAAVHAAGLLHRDVKPANIILGDDGVARLVDFGISSSLVSEQLQQLSGTLAYMAPEQARGEVSRMGPRSDVFGLGAVLYGFLTGKPPHQGRDTQEVWAKAKEGRIVPPSQIKANLPRRLERVCLKAMAAKPEERFASAAELQQALRRCRRKPAWVAVAAGAAAIAACLALLAFFRPQLFGLYGPNEPKLAGTIPTPNEKNPPSKKPLAKVNNASVPLTAEEFSVLVWSQNRSTQEWIKRGWDIRQKETLPIRNGDLLQIKVKLSEPAHIYLLWIDSEGVTTPLYPWNTTNKLEVLDISGPIPQPKPEAVIYSPPGKGQGWVMGGEDGLETVILLARREPLPDNAPLASLFKQGIRRPFANKQELVLLGYDGHQSIKSVSLSRGPQKQAKAIDDATLALLDRLQEEIGFEIIRAVSFAHVKE